AEVTNTPTRPEARGAGSNEQERLPAPAAEQVTVAEGGRVKSSPLARKIAAAAGVDIRQVPPTGPGGRGIRRDVEVFVEKRPAERAPSPAPAVRTAAAARLTTERIPLNRMRAAIAKGMTEAKRNAPDIHVTVDIRVDEVVKIRERLNQKLAKE